MELARSAFTLPGKKDFKRVKVCYDADWITSLYRSENTQKNFLASQKTRCVYLQGEGFMKGWSFRSKGSDRTELILQNMLHNI